MHLHRAFLIINGEEEAFVNFSRIDFNLFGLGGERQRGQK
jgi:hypothetical protein